MPFYSEHRARILLPTFDAYRRKTIAPGIALVLGRYGGGPMVTQAVAFDAETWNVAAARAWLTEHGYEPIKFEAAIGSNPGDPGRKGKRIMRTRKGPRNPGAFRAGLAHEAGFSAPMRMRSGALVAVPSATHHRQEASTAALRALVAAWGYCSHGIADAVRAGLPRTTGRKILYILGASFRRGGAGVLTPPDRIALSSTIGLAADY